jgi:hypothetical protein
VSAIFYGILVQKDHYDMCFVIVNHYDTRVLSQFFHESAVEEQQGNEAVN